MAAAAVRPHPREDALGLGAPGQQELPGRVEHVAREGQMQRRRVVMHADLAGYAPRPPALVEQYNVFHKRARYQGKSI
jgi:hypothetical protein